MVRHVAEILHLKGCFGVRPRRPPALEILTHASAAQAVQDGVPFVVWLDKHAEAIMLTERWADTVYTQRLPLQLEVMHLSQPLHRTPEEDVIATISFCDRASVEVFVKLGQHVLPEWLAFRQGALGQNLLVHHGFWLIGYYGRALQLQSIDGSFTGLLQLNLDKPCVELIVHHRNQCTRSRAVHTLQMAAELLHKDVPKQRLNKDAQHAVQGLQPSLPRLQRLKAQLNASVDQARGAPNMRCFTEVGIIAALADCAAAHLTDRQEHQRNCSSSSSRTEPSVIQGIAECICLVLWNTGEQSRTQATLLVSCVARCLGGTRAQADRAALLLATLLKQMHHNNGNKWQPFKQAIQDTVLLRHLLHCCNSTAQPTVQQMLQLSGCLDHGPQSHPLAAHLDAIQFDIPLNQIPATSTAGAQPVKSVVPRLPLPGVVPVTPPLNSRSSRLGQSAPSEQHSPVHQPSSAGAAQAKGSRSMSRLALLQHLGHSCGENAMAADLAAFVTHKQLHASQAVDGIQQKWGQLQEGAHEAQSLTCPTQITPGQLSQLPSGIQLRLRSLECIHLLVQQLPAGYPLPPSLGCIMGHGLLSTSLARHCQDFQQTTQHAAWLIGQGMQWQQHFALQVLKACVGSSQAPNCSSAFSMRGPVHNSVLSQFKEQLTELSKAKRPSAQVHLVCRDTLVSLRNYLNLSNQTLMVETVCSLLGYALGQLEHMLRASRVSLWSWPAVQHMDALVQVYLQLAEQASTPTAARHLLQILCPAQANTPRGGGVRPGGSSSGGGAATPSAAGFTLAWVPAGTLQLVLELLQHTTLCSDSTHSPTASNDSRRTTSGRARASTTEGAHGTRRADAVRQGGDSACAGPVAAEAVAVKVHCWKLLEAVLKLAERYQTSKVTGAGSSTSSSFGGYELSDLEQCSSLGLEWLPRPSAASGRQVLRCAQNSSDGSQIDSPCEAPGTVKPSARGSNWQNQGIANGPASQLDLPSSHRQLSSHRLSGLQHCKAADGGASTADVGAVVTNAAVVSMRSSDSSEQRSVSLRGVSLRLMNAISSAAVPSSPVASPPSVSSISTVSSGNGSEVVRALVDQLMRQRGSRPLVVHLLEEMDGSQVALPLQLQILNFISAAYEVPGGYPVKVPQLSEFYVHYHFLHFTRHYYKLLTCPNMTALACCKGHVKVLLALCRHTGGTNVVRRRFLQLKVLEFVVRELSVEHNLLVRQLGCGTGSACSTPHSSARLPSSRYSNSSGLVPCTGKQLSSSTATAGTCSGGLHHADEALTQRGVSGLLVSSLAGPSSADLCHIQPAHTAAACVQQQGGVQELDYTSASHSYNAIIEGNSTASPSGPEHQQVDGGVAAAIASPYKHGAVLSAVKKLEAAAAAATPVRVARVSSSSSGGGGTRHCRPVGYCFKAAAATEAATAKSSANAYQTFSSQGAATRQGLLLKPRPLQEPCHVRSLAEVGKADVVEASNQAMAPAEDSNPAWTAIGGSQQLLDTEAARPAAACPSSSTASSSLGTWRPAAAEQSEPTCELGEQQPQLTGDASYDGQLIEEWEERTGLEFVFDCLSSEAEEDSQHRSDCLSSDEQGVVEQCQSDSLPQDSTPKSERNRPLTLLQSVPRLALGGSAPLQRQGSSFSVESGCSYKPGLDLEDDFERMMSAEEAGRQGSWNFGDDGSSSDDSSLIAAGRDSPEQQELQSPEETARRSFSAGQAAACKRPLGLQQCAGCSTEANTSSSDVLSSPGGDAGTRQRPAPKALALQLSRTNCTQQRQHAPDADYNALADAWEDTGSLCEDSYLESAAGLHEAGDEEQSEAMLETPTAACGRPRPGRQSIVPHLRLPSDQHPVQLQGCTANVPGSARSVASGMSSCSTAGRHAVPSIMTAATPLLTTRVDRHVAYSSSCGSIHGMGKDLHCDGRLQTVAEPQAVMPASVYQAHRHMHAVYADDELHALCLELALHLLGTPMGSLDPLQLPQEPTDTSLQQKVFMLLAHLSDPDNASVLTLLVERVCSQSQLAKGCLTAATSSPPRLWDLAAAGSCGGAATATTDGLAGCAHRLLKLLSPLLLEMDQIQLGGTIQQGAFSEVKTATLLRDGVTRAVAVKVLDSTANDATCFERVYNEVAILEKLLGHKGVVPLLEYGVMCNNSISSGGSNITLGGQPQWLLVFPRYSTSLRAWRHGRGHGGQQGDTELYLRIFVQVASIVRDLHAANIVHYDIKGDNLLLDTSSSSSGSVPFDIVLADFGDACMFDSTMNMSAQRHRGTELFSSPEMLLLHAGQHHPGHEEHDRRKHRGVGPAHDVWSLGCTLYELMTGRVLFEEEGVGRITSYAPSSSAVGMPTHCKGRSGSAAGAGCSGGVLRSNERAALGHAGVIELVECMLAGNASWRPGAAEVVYKAERLLASM